MEAKKVAWLGIAVMALVPLALLVLVFAAIDTDDGTAEASARQAPERGSPAAEIQAPGRASPQERRRAVAAPRAEPPEPKEIPAPERDEAEDRAVVRKLEEARRVENTDPERSRALLREVLEIDPDNLPALTSLSTKVLIDEDHAEAHRLAERCRALDPTNDVCQKVGEQAIVQSGDLERLAGGMRRCLIDTPGNPDCMGGMVAYHLSKGEVGDAALYLGRLTQHDPDGPQTLFAAGRLQAIGGEYEEAARLFRAACVDLNYERACLHHETLAAEGW